MLHNKDQRLSLGESDKIKTRIKFLLILTLISGVFDILFDATASGWLKNLDNITCIPAENDNPIPHVYSLRMSTESSETSDLYNFIYTYVSWTQDESLVDYHKVTGDSRYKTSLKDTLVSAMNHSTGSELAYNQKKFENSFDMANILKRENYGIEFLIDCIQSVDSSGVYGVTVYGEHQIISDDEKRSLPPEFWGYKKIHYIIKKNDRFNNLEKNSLNKYGFTVVSSLIEEVNNIEQIETYRTGCNQKDIL